MSLQSSFRRLLEEGIREDSPQWDWTTRAIGKDRESTRWARIVAKEDGIWAGDLLCESLRSVFLKVRLERNAGNGDAFSKGKELCHLEGPAGELLVLERTFLNLLSYVCGVATETRNLVERTSSKVRVTPTRKILPGYRDLSVYGVLQGGGSPHRLNLACGVLIKENHIELYGSIQNAIEKTRELSPHSLKIEIEVKNLSELEEALQAGADVIMLDNFTPEEVQEAVRKKTSNVLIEVSGGINRSNIESYCIDGVDVISVGALTHSVRSLDMSFLIDARQ